MVSRTRRIEGNLTCLFGVICGIAGVCVLLFGFQGRTRITSGSYALSAIGFGLFWAASACWRYGKKLKQPTAEELRAVDFRSPVLLLRSFEDDELVGRATRFSDGLLFHPNFWRTRGDPTVEEEMEEVLRRIGPVIAIGRPGERLAPLGASRTYASDETWKDKFLDLIEDAALTVIVFGSSRSLRWEIERALTKFRWDTLILFVRPTTRGQKARRRIAKELRAWEELRRRLSFLPQIDARTAALLFDPDGEPIHIDVDKPSLRHQVSAWKEAVSAWEQT